MLFAGAGLRAWFMWSYRPAFVGYPDARAYILAARGPLYWNPYKPVGYPLFLRGLRAIDGRLSVTVAAQHALGLASGGVAYAMTARVLRRRGLALLPAAVVLLGGSQVFLEHAILSDAPYTFLLTIVLYCGVRGLAGGSDLRWLAGAGLALAASVTMRTVGVFLIPVVAGWAAGSATADTSAGSRRAGALLLCSAAPLAGYLVAQHSVTGSWGLTRSTNFALYARLAPLADCSRLKPPPGTEGLCEQSAPRSRPNANWYIFDLDSPAIRHYGVPPWPLERVPPAAYRWPGNEPTGRFARAVLRAQPLDYLASVLEGLANYVRPRAGRPSVFEYDQRKLIAELHNERFEAAAGPDIASYYTSSGRYLRRNVRALESFGRAARTEGPLTAVLAIGAAAGVLLARGTTARAACLFASSALSLAAAPVALLFYDVRYAAPMAVPLTAAAAIGLDRLCDRSARRSSPLAGSSRCGVRRASAGCARCSLRGPSCAWRRWPAVG